MALMGVGNVGRLVAQMLQAFGANISSTGVARQSDEIKRCLDLTYYDNFETMLP